MVVIIIIIITIIAKGREGFCKNVFNLVIKRHNGCLKAMYIYIYIILHI